MRTRVRGYALKCIASVPFHYFLLIFRRSPEGRVTPMHTTGRTLFRAAAAVGMLLLSGCVVYPAGPYYHPHYYGWYRY
jgi:hypothetical protein